MLETSSFCILSWIHLHDAAVVVESDAARDPFCCEFAAPGGVAADGHSKPPRKETVRDIRGPNGGAG